MTKLDYKNVILSVTMSVAIAYVICRIFYAVLPEQTLAFAGYLFHGISVKTELDPLTLSGFIIGLIETIILSIIGSALFVWIYNKISKN